MDRFTEIPVKLTIEEVISELKREIKIREKCYPEWVYNYELCQGLAPAEKKELPFKVQRGAKISRNDALDQYVRLKAALGYLEWIQSRKVYMQDFQIEQRDLCDLHLKSVPPPPPTFA